MMKSKSALIALALVSAVSLTACGGAKETPKPPAQSTPAANATPQDAAKAGADKMLKALEATKKAIDAKDAAGAQKAAKEAEETWATFEDGVRDKSKDLYVKIEDQLQIITAGVKVTPLDAKILDDAIDKLGDLLKQMDTAKADGGAKQGADLKAGAAAMLHDIDMAKQAVTAGDAATAQKETAETDEAWETIEGQVKEKGAELYTKIEDNIHALQAAVKASPLDTKAAGDAITKLQTLVARIPALAGDIPAGVDWMKHEVDGTKKAADAKDSAKALKEAEEADAAWETFEDAVKAKDKDLYGKIEEQLHALLGAVKAPTLDANAIGDVAVKLNGLLDQAAAK